MQERMTSKQFLESGLTASFNKSKVKQSLPKKPPLPKKYRNIPTSVGGIRFDSKKEADRWVELQFMQRANLISNLDRQVVFELAPSVMLHGETKEKKAMRYICDFYYLNLKTNEYVIEDVKSKITSKLSEYRNKKHLMKTQLGLDIIEI